MARTHRIAVVPGDGIGKETVPEALKVLDAASRRFGFGLIITGHPGALPCPTQNPSPPA